MKSLLNKRNLISALFTLTGLALNVALHATSCQLLFDEPIKVKSELGPISLKDITSHSIIPELTSNVLFYPDELYGLSNGKKQWFFRVNERGPVLQTNYSIYLTDWANNVVPPAGTYAIATYETTRKPKFKQTIDTIGDSITWVRDGRYLRCLLRDQGLRYDFKGSHTDTFGFEHDGEGGDTTQAVLNRINKIPTTDAYFLLIGTNDRTAPENTATNIIKIAKQLSAKNSKATIYISTLLPRNDTYLERNLATNKLLLQTKSICPNCKVIDVGGELYALKNWQQYFPDQIHPNYKGYVELTKIITKQMARANIGTR
ncbi:GDSL-like Lipase/Acylhydrolase [Legionella beliardensis]|uniref:GDSL-like Lipase/Acylhydrolase n=1 Tax=Legionella beliardensis TaxID=91822 RepID=A0A378I4Q2_9GAMM|nr:SGNH/GDSL hydrolase family protein [Legionella beliardensis]STX30168.1 GDSL-like Lipase/Acylhydrolase [Legionella beliardensis]